MGGRGYGIGGGPRLGGQERGVEGGPRLGGKGYGNGKGVGLEYGIGEGRGLGVKLYGTGTGFGNCGNIDLGADGTTVIDLVVCVDEYSKNELVKTNFSVISNVWSTLKRYFELYPVRQIS